MLPSYLQWPCHIYLALGGDKGTKLRIRLTGNGITIQELPAYTIFSQKLPEWKGGFWGALRGWWPARRVGGRQKEKVYAAKWY